jgi:hypothetical protein
MAIRKVLRMASGQHLEIDAYADIIELAGIFTLEAVFSLSVVIGIDIPDISPHYTAESTFISSPTTMPRKSQALPSLSDTSR